MGQRQPSPGRHYVRVVLSRAWLLVALGLVVALGLSGCTSTDPFDRGAAVDEVIRQSGGRLTRPQAECYVDRVVGELGSGALTPGSPPVPEMIPRLTGIRIDCTGVASLGTDPPPVPTTFDPGLGSQPTRFGDDPDLDPLYVACRDGGGQACDDLFAAAPLGSEYEEFASTCGGRTKELSCASRYPETTPGGAPVPPSGPGVTATTTTIRR